MASVREVISHPLGGKVEVFVWPDAKVPGLMQVKPVVYYNGKKREAVTVDIAD